MPLLSLVKAMASAGADLLGPRRCAACGGELIEGEQALCLRCLTTLPRPVAGVMAIRFADIFANSIAPQGITEAWHDYDPGHRRAGMIWQAKYYDSPALARELGYTFGRELMHRYGSLPLDVLLPVPMHWRKRMSRGYNQSLEIARGLSRATGIAVGDNLAAIHAHATQTRKSHSGRRHNIAGTIAVDYPHELDGLRLAIVDDIVTTGATIGECIAALTLSGARPASIGFLTLGATVKRK